VDFGFSHLREKMGSLIAGVFLGTARTHIHFDLGEISELVFKSSIFFLYLSVLILEEV
jgi:hypothetical protein